MRKWLLVFLVLAAAGGAAYAIRAGNIDLASLTGLKASGAGEKPAGTPAGKSTDKGKAAGGQRGPTPVETAKASEATVSDDITAIGNLLADESVAIAPETSGRIAKIQFEDGAVVEAGKPLFQLDTDLAQADLTEAKARQLLAEANLERSQRLQKSGNVAQSTLDAALTERAVADAAVSSAEVHLKKLTITAPFPGTLGFRSVSEGAYVTAGTALVQLDKTDKLNVSFSVPELELPRVNVGQKVEVSADAYPGQTFEAAITAINPSVDVNGRALQVRARLDNASQKLKPGLLVRITIKGEARKAVLVPEAAIIPRGEQALIYVVADGKVTAAKVKTAKRMPGVIEITSGIAAGDEVVVSGNSRLSDGAAVEVVPAPKSAE